MKSRKGKIIKTIHESSIIIELEKKEARAIMEALNVMRRMRRFPGTEGYQIMQDGIPVQLGLIRAAKAVGMDIPPFTNEDYWEIRKDESPA